MSNREGAVGLPLSFCGRSAELQKTPLGGGFEMCAKGGNCQAVGTIVYNNPSAFNIKTRSKSLKYHRTGTGRFLMGATSSEANSEPAEKSYVPEKLKDP
ncbi:hypothetical protein BN1708_013479, partial [Verticillium longisporum]